MQILAEFDYVGLALLVVLLMGPLRRLLVSVKAAHVIAVVMIGTMAATAFAVWKIPCSLSDPLVLMRQFKNWAWSRTVLCLSSNIFYPSSKS